MVKGERNINNSLNSDLAESGYTGLVLKFNIWKKGEEESVEPQWTVGQDFVCHQWMNAALHCTPVREGW